jgi:hypothetical protein
MTWLTIFLIVCLLSVPASVAQSIAPQSGTPLLRRYTEGEVLSYHMKASNQGRNQTIRYEADAEGVVKKDGSGHFGEEFRWSGLSFNEQVVALPAGSFNSRQHLSLDPAVTPALPDFTHVNPMLIGPMADLLTFYSDLWLAIKQRTLVHVGDHRYFKHGIPNSWADGARTLIGQDSIDFDLTLVEVNIRNGSAKLAVRHVPPAQPQIKVPAKWMEAPVEDTANNWIEVSKEVSGQYLAEVGRETFNVDITVSVANGKILAAEMDNSVAVFARECHDEALGQCGKPEHYQIRRRIELRSVQ